MPIDFLHLYVSHVMPPTFTFTASPALHFGPGKLSCLPSLLKRFGSRLLIVVGGHSFLSGKEWPALAGSLQDHGFAYHLERIGGEPSPMDIDTICRKYRNQAIDAVVAIGGGSVLDGGKAVSAMLVEQQPVITFLEGVGTAKPSGRKVPFVAVPTTSGTGSEATSNAVISTVGRDGFKKSLRHDKYVPDIALIDPILTISCPATLTVACGMDTFSQLVEAFLSSKSSPLADTLALEGIRAVLRSLKQACGNGGDLQARADMAYASYLSGMVLANAGLGTVHGFASAIGGLFTIPHGIVCGTLMAATNRATLNSLRETGENQAALLKYSLLGRMVSEKKPSAQKAQDLFIAYLENLTNGLGLACLTDFGISERDIDLILSQSGNKNNPVQLSRDELAQILRTRLNH